MVDAKTYRGGYAKRRRRLCAPGDNEDMGFFTQRRKCARLTLTITTSRRTSRRWTKYFLQSWTDTDLTSSFPDTASTSLFAIGWPFYLRSLHGRGIR